jgi:hypothetical protein
MKVRSLRRADLYDCGQLRSGEATAGPCSTASKPTEGMKIINEAPRSKLRGASLLGRHSVLDTQSSRVFWIPAFAGMTNSRQAAGNAPDRLFNGSFLHLYLQVIPDFFKGISRTSIFFMKQTVLNG